MMGQSLQKDKGRRKGVSYSQEKEGVSYSQQREGGEGLQLEGGWMRGREVEKRLELLTGELEGGEGLQHKEDG